MGIKGAICALWEKWKRYDEAHNFTCDVCGREVFDGERVCADCMKTLPFNDGAICPLCGRAVGEAGVCLECKEKPLAVRKARSVFRYEGEAARLVLRFKRGERYLYRLLALLISPMILEEFPESELLVGVPMTKHAKKRRGYDQIALLTQEVSRMTGLPVLEGVYKVHESVEQKSLGRREREENLEGCFRVEKGAPVKGKRVLVIDDALTTGSTVSELARTLFKAGASAVDAATLTGVELKVF